MLYVNDNYGDFTAAAAGIVRSALQGSRPALVKPVLQRKDSMILTKVRHSATSPPAYLLRRLETTTIALAGQLTEQCLLYTAFDG